MSYIVSAIASLKKQVWRFVFGLLLGATFFGGAVADSSEGRLGELRYIPAVAVILLLVNFFWAVFASMGGANPSAEEEPPGIMALNLGVALGSGIVIASVVNPLFGVLYTIGLSVCTNGLIYLGIFLIGLYKPGDSRKR